MGENGRNQEKPVQVCGYISRETLGSYDVAAPATGAL